MQLVTKREVYTSLFVIYNSQQLICKSVKFCFFVLIKIEV